MRGIWGNFWIRAGTTVLVVIAATILFNGMPLVHLVWGGGVVSDGGVLDFAGGSVVHLNPWLLVMLFWIAAEVKALRTKSPLPFGCYLIFIAVVTFCLGWLPWLATGFVDRQGAAILALGEAVISLIVAAIPTAIYYALLRRRVARPPAPDVF